MLMDAKMDHGPILLQEKRKAAAAAIAGNQSADNIRASDWPKRYADFEEEMARQGADLIANNIENILGHNPETKILPQEQDHAAATFTKKFDKADGEIRVDPSKDDDGLSGEYGRKQFLKFNAFYEWPTTYFFATLPSTLSGPERTIRIKITDAVWENSMDANESTTGGSIRGFMKILKVIPEGQKETLWSEFKKRLA